MTSTARRRVAAFLGPVLGLCLLGAVAAGPAHAQATAIGLEFPVNSYTLGGQQRPAIAIDSTGGFVVVWQSGVDMAADRRFVVAWASPQDGAGYGVFARRFDAAGTPLASEFQVNVDGNGVKGALTDGLLFLRWLFGFTGATLTAVPSAWAARAATPLPFSTT
jgi:hypothetical protein